MALLRHNKATPARRGLQPQRVFEFICQHTRRHTDQGCRDCRDRRATDRVVPKARTRGSLDYFVDGTPAAFSTINVSPIEAFYPVVAQHGLQTFIHSKPKDRRDAICAAFGLDELTALKNALDSARSSFQRSPPRSVTDARRELAAQARTLAEINETQDLARRWQLSPMQVKTSDNTQALLAAAQALTGSPCPTVDEALAKLRETRSQASRSVFDAGKLAPNEGKFGPLDAGMKAVVDALLEVERAIAITAATTASTYKTAFLELWKAGLDLSPSGDQCPMCEADTLTVAKRDELSKRLADNVDRMQKNDSLLTAVASAKARIANYRSHVKEFGVDELPDADLEQLRRLFSQKPEDLDAFISELDAFNAARKADKDLLDKALEFLDICIGLLEISDKIAAVVAQAATLKDDVSLAAAGTLQAFQRYEQQWKDFEPKLSALISSDAFVARIDAVGKTLKLEPKMRLLDRYEKVLEESQELIRSVEAEMQTRQAALLTTRGAEVKALYDRLNRGADVVFDNMEPGTDIR